jgi:hypothetical protein
MKPLAPRLGLYLLLCCGPAAAAAPGERPGAPASPPRPRRDAAVRRGPRAPCARADPRCSLRLQAAACWRPPTAPGARRRRRCPGPAAPRRRCPTPLGETGAAATARRCGPCSCGAPVHWLPPLAAAAPPRPDLNLSAPHSLTASPPPPQKVQEGLRQPQGARRGRRQRGLALLHPGPRAAGHPCQHQAHAGRPHYRVQGAAPGGRGVLRILTPPVGRGRAPCSIPVNPRPPSPHRRRRPPTPPFPRAASQHAQGGGGGGSETLWVSDKWGTAGAPIVIEGAAPGANLQGVDMARCSYVFFKNVQFIQVGAAL